MLKALLNKLFGVKTAAPAENTSASGAGSLSDLQGFVEYVAKSLVDAPEEVRVNLETREDGSVLKIDCRKEDIGKIVGKRGKTIMAIRSLVSGAAGRQHKRVSVDVMD